MAKFQPGNKAAVGRRPKTTLLSKLRDAVSPAWDDIVRAVIEQAKAGDMQAVTILANRVAPVPKAVGPAIQLDIDPSLNPAERLRAITAATLAGEVSPDQARILADLITAEVQLIELTELEGRIAALEGHHGLTAITRRVDRLTGPTSHPPAIVAQFVRPGAEPQPITTATCRDIRYTREPDESEQAFLDRIEAQHPPTREGFTVILVRD